ncbi:MAG: hypothetical protein Q8R25_01520 [bacterium]|nr:hypothetical protein [bacterium]
MQQYVYWILWKYKLVVFGLVAYAVIHVISPKFAEFSLIVLPIIIIGASVILSLMIFLECGESKFITASRALEISVCTIGMMVTAAIVRGRLLIEVFPPDTPMEQVVLTTFGAIFAGAILGLADMAMYEYFKKSSRG